MISNLIFFPSKKTISALKTNTPFVFKLVRAKVEGSIGDSWQTQQEKRKGGMRRMMNKVSIIWYYDK